MAKRNSFNVLRALFFAGLLMAFSLTGIAYGAAKNDASVKEWKIGASGDGKILLAAQAKKRSVPLVGSSVNKIMPPPCIVTAVRGKTVTLRDFKGQTDTVEVLDAAGIRVGEHAVVKNGHLTVGLPPE
jgi:hypothetical protein